MEVLPKRWSKINRRKLVITACLILITALVVGGALYYRSTQANRIYSVGQSMKFPGFRATITSAKFSSVSLPLNQDVVKQYGGIETDENCDTFSKAPLPPTEFQALLKESIIPNPSPYNYCIRRNDSRKDLRSYASQNKLLTIQYLIKSSGTVITKNLSTQVLPDSGRNPNPKDSPLPGNELLFNDLSNDMLFNYNFQAYKPYSKSDLGGNVNSGLSRSGWIKVDVRNTEKTVDVTFSYWINGKVQYKTTRINNP